MDNEIKNLISTFRDYRDLITPIEQNLREFSLSFENISDDLKNLNASFDGNIQNKLDKIYNELSQQADKAKTLSSQVDNFMTSSNKYISSIDKLLNTISKIEERIETVDRIQNDADKHLENLSVIIEEKKKNYDLKSLEKNLENYNIGVQKVSEYINAGVVDSLKNNGEKINELKDKSNNILEILSQEKSSIEKLITEYITSNTLLKKIVENNDVNEEYIFEILDKWAKDRKVKTKK